MKIIEDKHILEAPVLASHHHFIPVFTSGWLMVAPHHHISFNDFTNETNFYYTPTLLSRQLPSQKYQLEIRDLHCPLSIVIILVYFFTILLGNFHTNTINSSLSYVFTLLFQFSCAVMKRKKLSLGLWLDLDWLGLGKGDG